MSVKTQCYGNESGCLGDKSLCLRIGVMVAVEEHRFLHQSDHKTSLPLGHIRHCNSWWWLHVFLADHCGCGYWWWLRCAAVCALLWNLLIQN